MTKHPVILLKFFIIVFAFSFPLQKGNAQSEYGRQQFGVYFMGGNSQAIISESSTLNNQLDDGRRGFIGSGLFCFFQLRDDSIYNTAGFFRFMRVDLGLSNRAGLFEPKPGDFARINAACIDLTALFPLSFKAAQEIDAYVAIGPMISYRYSWATSPSQNLPNVDDFNGGFALELGFRLKSGSAIGYRTMLDLYGNYRYRVGSIFFGFSPQNISTKRRQKKL